MARANAYFIKHGIEGPETTPAYHDWEQTKPAGYHTAFGMDIGSNVRLATEIVFEIFERVYRFPRNFEFIITEN